MSLIYGTSNLYYCCNSTTDTLKNKAGECVDCSYGKLSFNSTALPKIPPFDLIIATLPEQRYASQCIALSIPGKKEYLVFI